MSYGTWEIGGEGYGPNRSDHEARAAIHAALDAGINFIDTGEMYGRGHAEELVGRALRGRDSEGVVVATKVTPRPVGTGFRASAVRRACETSLRRLDRDVIDIYYLHWPDDTVPLEETWEAMAELPESGLVRTVGLSNFGRALTEQCMKLRPVDSVQIHFSMLHLAEIEYLEWCAEQGIPIVAYGALGYGLLTGAISRDATFDEGDWRSGRSGSGWYYDLFFSPMRFGRCLAVAEALGRLAEGLGITAPRLALAWTLHQPGIVSAIMGTRDPGHVRDNALAAEVDLDPSVLQEIEEEILPLGPEFFG